MNITFQNDIHDHYLKLTVQGQWVLNEMLALTEVIKDEAMAAGRDRVFIDFTAVEGRIPELDRYSVGVQIAKIWQSKLRVAILYQADQINKFAENVAVNRGARIFVTWSEADALDWLLRDLKDPPQLSNTEW